MTFRHGQVRFTLATLCGVFLFLIASVAFAVGRVEWANKSPKERDNKSWRLELKIYLPSPPDVAHMPMKFEFQPTAYYERSMVDGDKLLERTVPFEHRQSLIESVDVGFLDPGTGKTQSRTKFSFKVTRAHGYEAGEYKVTIRDSRNGRQIGTPTTLKFLGENEIIDRRSIVFTGEKKKKKPEEGEGETEEQSSEPEEMGEPSESDSYETADAPNEDEALEPAEADGPPPIEEKPGGCGCMLPASRPRPTPYVAGALGLILVFSFRRHRSNR